ncbi:MAG: PaaI family thioesterase [Granulosicoccus sp.]|nr:PaaI family thioesterase [Granulosicoccus sp.]
MNNFVVKDNSFKEKVRESFFNQEVMNTIGASPVSIEPGHVEIEFAYKKSLTQHHGFIHAGIVSTVLDSACGYAAFTLMPEKTSVLTIEFKINLLSPARGDQFLAIGKVKKPGRTITVSEGELYAVHTDSRKLIATMTGTLMTVNTL